MRAAPAGKSPANRGFTLLEMMVNLGLMLVVMLVIAKIAGHTSHTVISNSGKLAAVEKSDSLKQFLKRDLGSVVRLDSTEDALVCEGDASTWKLWLRIPVTGGWQEVDYAWSRKNGTMDRWSTVDGKRVKTTIATGITKLETRWPKSTSEDVSTASEDWQDGSQPPALGNFILETTRAREEGKRDAVRDTHVESSRVAFTLPVGGGILRTP